jgi:hypothetical protein
LMIIGMPTMLCMNWMARTSWGTVSWWSMPGGPPAVRGGEETVVITHLLPGVVGVTGMPLIVIKTNFWFFLFSVSSRYGPPVRTQYRRIVENLSSRVSWQVILFGFLLTLQL